MFKIKTREAILGVVTYRLAKYAVRRTLKKGGGMARKKKTALFAGLGALVGALFFWRRKKRHTEASES